MNLHEQTKIIERLALLKNMTVDRGCAPGEADTAALKIGQLVQRYDLQVTFTSGANHRQEQAKPSSSSRYSWREREEEDDFEYGFVTVRGDTEKAICVKDEDGNIFWVPRSQLRQGCEDWTVKDTGMLYVSAWWAKKEGWN